MNKATLICILQGLTGEKDFESAHCEADDALIDYIDDSEIKDWYGKIGKWYA